MSQPLPMLSGLNAWLPKETEVPGGIIDETWARAFGHYYKAANGKWYKEHPDLFWGVNRSVDLTKGIVAYTSAILSEDVIFQAFKSLAGRNEG